MDVIFDKGISFSYFGDTQDGWYLEGCFTCIECEKIKENCWGSGHLIPKLGISNLFRNFFYHSRFTIEFENL